MRIYDESPTGNLPGEGCGVIVLMRTADARAAGLPVYAEIIGTGSSAGSAENSVSSDAGSQLLALSRAYERAGVDPADIQLIEGSGTALAAADEAELTALGMLRRHARRQAALGSITANIGHANAAAGAAGLIKVVLALGCGIVPPTTGVGRPHLLLRDGDANLQLPDTAAEWPGGHRLAGVSAMGAGGINVHLVLRNEPGAGSRPDRLLRVLPRPGRPEPGARPLASCRVGEGAARPAAYLLHAPDRRQLAGRLARVAELAGWLSDAEMHDLACQLARDAMTQGPVRAGIVAARQEELARQARTASSLLPGLGDGVLAAGRAFSRQTAPMAGSRCCSRTRPRQPRHLRRRRLRSRRPSPPGLSSPGLQLARTRLTTTGVAIRQPARGRRSRAAVAGEPDPTGHGTGGPPWPAGLGAALDALRWLESLDVHATAGVGHGFGEIAGLIWAGVLSEEDAAELAALRAELLRGPVATRSGNGRHAGRHHARAVADALPRDERALLRAATAHLRFGPPRRRLISASTGTELASADQVIDEICAGLAGAGRLADALGIAAVGATLLLEAGPPGLLAAAAAGRSRVPAISAGSGHGTTETGPGAESAALAAAALFAAGALGQPRALQAGQPSRPMDIWRERIFIAGPRPAGQDDPPGLPAAGPVTAQPGTRASAGTDPQPSSVAGLRALMELSRQATSPEPDLRAASQGPREPTARPGQRQPAARSGQRRQQAGQAQVARLPGPERDRRGSDGARQAWPGAADSVAGAGPWVRCFAEQLRDPVRPVRHTDDGPWQIRAAASNPFGMDVGELFRDDAAARRTLAIAGDPADAGACEEALERPATRSARGCWW